MVLPTETASLLGNTVDILSFDPKNKLMRRSVRASIAACLVAGSLLFGSAGTASSETSVYPIGAGDALQITIYAGGEEQENFTSVVSASGKISTPLLGEVAVEGMLPSQVSDVLAKRLAAGYYVKPRVIVGVKEYSGKVYVFGEVERPGAYSVREAMTALNACILAGGFSNYAALNRVKVIRQGKDRMDVYKIDLVKVRKGKKPDMVLRPGDRIEVPHRRF